MIINHETMDYVNSFIKKNKQIDCGVRAKELQLDAMRVSKKRYQRI